jgi:DNA-binding transcriptional MocR family regulator
MQSDIPAERWLAPLEPRGGPRYLQIVERLEDAIAAGRLRAGDRLTPQRAVATHLGVDLTTVTRAYAQARTRGLLVADGPRGTFVAARKVELGALVDLSLNIPPQPADPDLQELLKHGLAQVLLRADIDLLMTYHLVGGSAADRLAGARWLAPVLGDAPPERVVASPGSQAALCALILACTQAGETLLCEPLVYPGFRAAAAQLGRHVRDVEIDDEGMLPAALERTVKQSGARVVYLNPTIQNPTTVTMPERRRRAIAKMAARLDLQVIEDDPYWLLADAAPPPLARLAPERVHYVSTLSKCLSPGLRTAFVVSPDARRQAAFLAALRAFSLMRAPLTAVLATQWLQDGTAQRVLAGVRAEARARQDVAAQALAGNLTGPHASREGIHVWLPLPSYWTAPAFAQAARAQGLAITPSDAFASGRATTNAIRISLGAGRDRKRLSHALARLSDLLARRPSAEEAVVLI